MPWSTALARLGIEATIRLVDASQYTNRIGRQEYDGLVQDYGILMPPTLELRSHFHSTSTAKVGSRNITGVSDPMIDYLVESAEAAETLDQVIAAWRALDRVLLWDHYLIPLYAIDQRRTLHWDKFGRPPEPLYRPAYPDGCGTKNPGPHGSTWNVEIRRGDRKGSEDGRSQLRKLRPATFSVGPPTKSFEPPHSPSVWDHRIHPCPRLPTTFLFRFPPLRQEATADRPRSDPRKTGLRVQSVLRTHA